MMFRRATSLLFYQDFRIGGTCEGQVHERAAWERGQCRVFHWMEAGFFLCDPEPEGSCAGWSIKWRSREEREREIKKKQRGGAHASKGNYTQAQSEAPP